jgi:hypothetical protein
LAYHLKQAVNSGCQKRLEDHWEKRLVLKVSRPVDWVVGQRADWVVEQWAGWAVGRPVDWVVEQRDGWEKRLVLKVSHELIFLLYFLAFSLILLSPSSLVSLNPTSVLYSPSLFEIK